MTRIGSETTGRRLVLLVLLVLLACVATSCRPADSPEVSELDPGALQGAVLILLDTVRPDHLAAYGHELPTSPAIDRLAAEGVLFEQVVSAAPWTLPSVVAILSGQPPEIAFLDQKLSQSIVESIRDAGYATAAITEGGYVSRQFGFDRGFDEYIEEHGAVQVVQSAERYDKHALGGIENTFRLAREWVERHRGERFFLLIHTYEPHTPYNRPQLTAGLDPGQVGEVFEIERLVELRSGAQQLDEQDLKYLSALYDGGILESDRHVGRFVSFLDSLGLGDRTLIALTSDHGEELGQHYPRHSADHGHSLLDDQVLVPLIWHDPRMEFEISRVRAQVRTIDILPTLAWRLGAPVPAVAGSSLAPTMLGTETAGRPAYGGSTKAGPRRSFLRHLGYKYVEVAARQPQGLPPLTPLPSRIQLYDLQADPGETRNIAAERPELVERFRQNLAELKRGGTRSFEEPEQLNQELLERLRSLGYTR